MSILQLIIMAYLIIGLTVGLLVVLGLEQDAAWKIPAQFIVATILWWVIIPVAVLKAGKPPLDSE